MAGVQDEAVGVAVQWCKDYARTFEVSYAEAAAVLWSLLTGSAGALAISSDDVEEFRVWQRAESVKRRRP